jgi:hypothetical protein
MRSLLPWFVGFCVGTLAFFVGMYLKTVEKRKRLERKFPAQLSSFKMGSQTFSQNPMAAYPGEKQKKTA